jgi:hypothetical protein
MFEFKFAIDIAAGASGLNDPLQTGPSTVKPTRHKQQLGFQTFRPLSAVAVDPTVKPLEINPRCFVDRGAAVPPEGNNFVGSRYSFNWG